MCEVDIVVLSSSEEDKMKTKSIWIVRQEEIKNVFCWVVVSTKSKVVHDGFIDKRAAVDFAFYLNARTV